MTEKIICIILDAVRHSETSDIISAYSPTHGHLSLISRVSSSKSGRLRNARLQPLNIISSDITFTASREFQRLASFTADRSWSGIRIHPVKNVISLFVQDFLRRLLREYGPDTPLWDYIINSLSIFDASQKGSANFHLAFLIGMLPYIGISPDLTGYAKGYFFDMQKGEYVPTKPSHNDFAESPEAEALPLLSRMNPTNMHAFRFSASARRRLLAALLKYYSIHLPGAGNMKSVEVLTDIFS